ncbi:MAG: hypothetical protein V2I63_01080 [Pseudomonadales bacterium]|jgi:phenylacetic acid degradation operon negative regulatory protein|nr:hypothetical protein [Pseudomonadales bacterium]
MAATRNKPAEVLLDLLRSVGRRGYRVRFLVETGALFGFTENQVRVTLSRLCARGLVETPERGRYRLAQRTSAVNAFVERWREGESLTRPWAPGCWRFAHLEAPPCAADRWALDALGFREARSGLWVRPDNLSLAPAALRRLGRSLGLSEDTLFVAGRPDGDPVPPAWRALWQPEARVAAQRALLDRLRASAARLPGLDQAEARLETFRIGGEAIHSLAKDPLLPPELIDTRARIDLREAMLAYDALGRAIWAQRDLTPAARMPVPQLILNEVAEGHHAST